MTHPTSQYPRAKNAAVTRVMKANTKTNTHPEVKLRRCLHSIGLRYRKNYRVSLGGLSVRPDIVFTRDRVAVFVDGCFWHSCPEHGNVPRHNSNYWTLKLERNKLRDVLVTDALSAEGWTVVRVWEHTPAYDGAQLIADLVRQSRSAIVQASSQ